MEKEKLVLEGKEIDIWFRRNGMQSLNGAVLAQMVDRIDKMLVDAPEDMFADEYFAKIRQGPEYRFMMQLVQRAREIEEMYQEKDE